MRRLPANKRTLGYVAILATALAVAVLSSWTPLATQIDDYAYDWMFRTYAPASSPARSIILAIDDATYSAMGGVREYRKMLAQGLDLIAPAHPKVVAVDVILTDRQEETEDARLEQSMARSTNLVLAADLVEEQWESPLPRFARHAAAVGHDKSDENSADGVTRQIPLEVRTAGERHWALALEAFRLAAGQPILESPRDLQIGSTVIPARRTSESNRPLRVLYTRDPIPEVSLQDLTVHPELAAKFQDRVVFFGVTSVPATRDRVITPWGNGKIPGVAVHAQLFETLARGRFLTPASNLTTLGLCALIGMAAGAIFVLLSGWPAYLAAGILLALAHASPFGAFRQGVVLPYFAPLASAWLTCATAAVYQHFVVRRALETAETEKKRYQQAIHFVTHEMRTPLTAIQGSSELMGRYNLSDDKRKQIAEMINQESKRLARMIQTFLDVERLSDGQIELKRERFLVRDIVEACLKRVQSLADRKNIQIQVEELDGSLEGDRELMEYVVYNLLTNAVKYSGEGTQIRVACRLNAGELRLSVQDQGIGIDSKDLRQIFNKFYRTKRAESSGEAGTGIGLSIVEQIVRRHNGRMEVTSEPGKGSCFTVVLQALARAPQSPAVSV